MTLIVFLPCFEQILTYYSISRGNAKMCAKRAPVFLFAWRCAALCVMNHAGCFPAELLSFFILFLPRGRKKVAKKEDAARLKFSCVPGCSDAQPCQCLRRKRRETFIFTNGTYHARLRDASEHPSTCRSFRSRHRKISNRRAPLHGAGRLNGNRKQRPINYRRPPSTRAAL